MCSQMYIFALYIFFFLCFNVFIRNCQFNLNYSSKSKVYTKFIIEFYLPQKSDTPKTIFGFLAKAD